MLIYPTDNNGFQNGNTIEVTQEKWKRMNLHHGKKLMWKETGVDEKTFEKKTILEPNLEPATTKNAVSRKKII